MWWHFGQTQTNVATQWYILNWIWSSGTYMNSIDEYWSRCTVHTKLCQAFHHFSPSIRIYLCVYAVAKVANAREFDCSEIGVGFLWCIVLSDHWIFSEGKCSPWRLPLDFRRNILVLSLKRVENISICQGFLSVAGTLFCTCLVLP